MKRRIKPASGLMPRYGQGAIPTSPSIPHPPSPPGSSPGGPDPPRAATGTGVPTAGERRGTSSPPEPLGTGERRKKGPFRHTGENTGASGGGGAVRTRLRTGARAGARAGGRMDGAAVRPLPRASKRQAARQELIGAGGGEGAAGGHGELIREHIQSQAWRGLANEPGVPCSGFQT